MKHLDDEMIRNAEAIDTVDLNDARNGKRMVGFDVQYEVNRKTSQLHTTFLSGKSDRYTCMIQLYNDGHILMYGISSKDWRQATANWTEIEYDYPSHAYFNSISCCLIENPSV